VTRAIKAGEATIGGGGPLVIIAGPCVIENRDITIETAHRLKEICFSLELPLIFKSSYDKANRTSIRSFRGPGLEGGLAILAEVKGGLGLPVLSDVHLPEECGPASEVLDILQIPAFLSRQTDLILAAAETGRPVNIKKGQFLAPWDVRNIIEKVRSTGREDIMITERGASFGYNNLVVDFRGLPLMRAYGYPVVFDVTHSLQQPVAVGVDALFMEVHPEPDEALSDGANMVALDNVEGLLRTAKKIHNLGLDGGSD
jgi:2-dehydro-3-deoxyphosphooctonate aldolase (KDO 8-P synthase)